MKTKAVSCVVGVVGLMAALSSVQGTIIFYEGFENQNLNAQPASSKIQQLASGKTASWSSNSSTTVIDDAGNKVLHMGFSNLNSDARLILSDGSAITPSDIPQGQNLVSTFRFRWNSFQSPPNSSNTDKMGYKLIGRTAAGQGTVSVATSYTDSITGYVVVSGAQALLPSETIIVGDWYELKSVYDLTNKTFVSTITDLNTGHSSSTTMAQAMGGTWSNSSTRIVTGLDFTPDGARSSNIDIDEIKLEIVPEPATMVFLGLGSLLTFVRRRSH